MRHPLQLPACAGPGRRPCRRLHGAWRTSAASRAPPRCDPQVFGSCNPHVPLSAGGPELRALPGAVRPHAPGQDARSDPAGSKQRAAALLVTGLARIPSMRAARSDAAWWPSSLPPPCTQCAAPVAAAGVLARRALCWSASLEMSGELLQPGAAVFPPCPCSHLLGVQRTPRAVHGMDRWRQAD